MYYNPTYRIVTWNRSDKRQCCSLCKEFILKDTNREFTFATICTLYNISVNFEVGICDNFQEDLCDEMSTL